jgi:predicted nucleotidyltransferase
MNPNVKNVINTIVKLLIERYSPQKIILLGSYANETNTKDSDIDLLIIKEGNKKSRIERFIEVKRIIYNPSLKIPISPLVLTKDELDERINMGDDFIKEIISGGEVLYER